MSNQNNEIRQFEEALSLLQGQLQEIIDSKSILTRQQGNNLKTLQSGIETNITNNSIHNDEIDYLQNEILILTNTIEELKKKPLETLKAITPLKQKLSQITKFQFLIKSLIKSLINKSQEKSLQNLVNNLIILKSILTNIHFNFGLKKKPADLEMIKKKIKENIVAIRDAAIIDRDKLEEFESTFNKIINPMEGGYKKNKTTRKTHKNKKSKKMKSKKMRK